MPAFAAVGRAGQPVPRKPRPHVPQHREPNSGHVRLALAGFAQRSTTLGFATTFLRCSRQLRLWGITLFVLESARHIHTAAVNGEDQPSLHHPDAGKHLRHPLTISRGKRLLQRLGPFAQHFDERLITFGRFGLIGVTINDNLACSGEAFNEGFFVRPRPQQGCEYQSFRSPSTVRSERDPTHGYARYQPPQRLVQGVSVRIYRAISYVVLMRHRRFLSGCEFVVKRANPKIWLTHQDHFSRVF